MSQKDHRIEVYIKKEPLFCYIIRVCYESIRSHTGAVHQNIYPSERIDCGVNQLSDVCLPAKAHHRESAHRLPLSCHLWAHMSVQVLTRLVVPYLEQSKGNIINILVQ
ncbi:unnamed protein product [Oppiella nova]|uniref:Uncharacterized protein n=1 Tax=Oppiella nova TaxID=334625 RepID=A0A7R9M5J5_9ACAR|nr:unnamed protein product [Oppiella nova]CAG2171063.1 unnamed protein product [Oppiella nova]